MTRLASQLRHGEVWVAGLWVATAGLAVLAALLGWGWLLGASLLLNYVADGLFFRVDERAVRWFNDRQMASVHRHLFREAIAALGWVVIERPGPLVVTAVIAAVIVVHGAHTAYRVLAARNRRLRRGRVGWQGLVVRGQTSGPQILPPTLPRVWTVAGPRFALHVDVPLVLGLWAGWTLHRDVPVWVGVGLVLVGAVFVGVRVVRRRRLIRRLPLPEEDNAAVLAALEAYGPEVVVYFSGGVGTTYQLNVWLETIDRIEQPAVLFVREALHLEELLPTSTPVLVLPRARQVEAFQLPSMKVALYPTTVGKNNHMLRLRGLRHVFINHGDGDKAVTYSPAHRVFDEIWVAGQAACDRYLERGEGVRPEQLVKVGRPQLAHIERAVPRRQDGRPVTVLYAPTWEGNFDGVNYSSVATMGERLVDLLLGSGMDVRVLFKAHPATGTRLQQAAEARSRIEHRLAASAGRHAVVASSPAALYDAFNEADVLVADVSSVVADFLASRKPYLVTDPRGAGPAAYHQRFPSSAGGAVVPPDCSGLAEALEDAMGADLRRERREALATYFLGEPVADPVGRFVQEVRRACERAELVTSQLRRAALHRATDEHEATR